MIKLLIVGDGARDSVTVPFFAQKVLGEPIEPDAIPWPRLQSNRGYAARLQFAMLQARNRGTVGLIAVVDADRDPQRDKLKRLKEGREKSREKAPPFPTALGEAVPHGESWLLDDPVAIRHGLGLESKVEIPTIRDTKSPKDTIEELRKQGSRREEEILDLLAAIAEALEPKRCVHEKETGFHGFCEELRSELGPLVKPRR